MRPVAAVVYGPDFVGHRQGHAPPRAARMFAGSVEMMAERGMIPLSAVVAIDLTQHAYHGKGRRGRPRRPVQGWHLVVRDVHGRRDADGGPHARRLHHARPEAGTCQARDRRVQEGGARGAVSKHKINAKKGAKGKRREFTMVVVKGFKIKGGRRVAACLVFATNMSVDGAMDALSSIPTEYKKRWRSRRGIARPARRAPAPRATACRCACSCSTLRWHPSTCGPWSTTRRTPRGSVRGSLRGPGPGRRGGRHLGPAAAARKSGGGSATGATSSPGTPCSTGCALRPTKCSCLRRRGLRRSFGPHGVGGYMACGGMCCRHLEPEPERRRCRAARDFGPEN